MSPVFSVISAAIISKVVVSIVVIATTSYDYLTCIFKLKVDNCSIENLLFQIWICKDQNWNFEL
jgi:hypothetical protein